jgi:Predicted Zn peptidase
MPSVEIDISQDVLDWAINQAIHGETTPKIMEYLTNWSSGIKKPTFRQLEEVSRGTGIPFGYFLLQAPPIESVPVLEYRTIDSTYTIEPSRGLVKTIYHMESIQDWMHDYKISEGYGRVDFVGSVTENNSSIDIANRIRLTANIKKDWHSSVSNINEAFRFFRKKFEALGILIMLSGIVGSNTHKKLNIEEFRAFTLLDDYAPLVFINSTDSNGAKLFSLIHECVHIWLGKDNFFNDRRGSSSSVSPIETLCNAVTAEILVPNDLFILEWGNSKHLDKISRIEELSSNFKCGRATIARRALDNRYITRKEYEAVVNRAIEQFEEAQKNNANGGQYYATEAFKIDNRFLLALDSSLKEGKTQFTDAYRLTNTTRKTFAKLVDKVRGIGQ